MLGWILPIHSVELGQDLVANHLRQHHMLFGPFPHQADVLVHIGREVVQTTDPVVIILDR